mmetsp:Transcript_80652/g.218438  ORF Transcript_80652/g.218438 Transcript_80652/m.218438 type:complete len:355 (+) Transcript_80652:76-1140(+)
MPLPPTTLPIVRRGSRLLPPDAAEEGPGLPAARRAAAGLLSGGSSEATSDAGDERSVTVKNTFLDVSSSEDLAESPRLAQTWSVGAWTAQVCSARPEPRGPRAEEAAPCLFESTPWGDSPLARAAARLPGEEAGAGAQQPAEVVLQVPLRVHPGHPLLAGLAPGGLEVEVAHEGGQTVLRLRLGAGQPGQVALAAPPTVVAARGAEAGGQASGGSGAAAPPRPPKRASATGTGAQRAGEKSAMVCCHWKNKGWCKFQDTCKFQHPDHKRGVGLAAAAGAAVLARQQRAAPSPAAQPVAGEAGRHCQPTAAGTAPAFLTPPPAVSPRLSAAPPMVRWVAAAGVAVPAQPCAAYFR